jgi:nicotinamide-nucleotide amidase
MIVPVEQAIHERLGDYVWGYDDETPEQSAGKSLTEKGLTLAVMEMCTGGALTNAITNVSNSSSYFKGGIVAYDGSALSASGVPSADLDQHEVVSQQTANTMAETVRRHLNADLGLAVTGVPGPGEFEGKPLGLAYIAVTNGEKTREMEMRLPPRQVTIKRRVPNQALIELRRLIEEIS